MPGYVRARGKRKDGSTKWQARYWDPKHPSRRIEKTFNNKREGERWLTRQGAAVLDGSHIDPRRAERPFKELADAYRETWADLEPKTRVGYEAILKRHLLPRFGKTKVGAISPEAVQRYVNELAEAKAPNTVRRIYGVLRGVLRVAVERRYIAVNPCDAVKLPKKASAATTGRQRQLYLTAPEVRQLAEAMPARYRLPVYVAAYCGLRAGELWALRRRDVDLLRGVLHVERALKEINSSADSLNGDKGLVFGPTKTHATRSVSLPAFLRPLLEAHLAEQDAPDRLDALVFTTPTGKPIRHNGFYKRVFKPTVKGRPATKSKPAVKAALPARLHGLRWHDLRHTAASLSLAVAPNLHVVKERLGHEDIRTTINVYGHLLPSVDAALADGLNGLFEAAEREQPDNVVELPTALAVPF